MSVERIKVQPFQLKEPIAIKLI